MSQEVVIVAAARTAIGSFLGGLSSIPATQLGAIAIKGAMEKAKLDPAKVEQVIMGNVLSAGLGQAPARQALIGSGIPKSSGATTINKVCGSGLQAVSLARNAIIAGESHCVVAGGMENMSLAPYIMPEARTGLRMGNKPFVDSMVNDGLWDIYNNFHMGTAGEMCAKEFKFSREDQDKYARQSFERAQAAVKSGAFKNEIVPVPVPQRKGDAVPFDTDEGPGKADFAKMGTLKPAFDKGGTITAANAATINDGAAALVVTSREFADKNGLKPLVRILSVGYHAQEPEWFTTAPVEAMKNALKKANLKVSDIDLFEVNEAFAVVAMAAAKGVEIPEEKMNVLGGGISLGHPIGASGARILTTLIHALEARNLKRGMVALCIGGGEGIAMIVERV
ncbi:MAG: acetyl-CoA C-acetyltransferase [Proteobacteria bacterium]|nr:MAG: acetyl-CoA C-acetyltransferase [Pseudomonadota bacterium]